MDALLDGERNGVLDDLVRQYAAGDQRAASKLAQAVLPAVLRHAQRMLGDPSEAEDVAQEAMMRLWKIAPEWRKGEAQVSTWLYRVTANLCVDRLRRRRGTPLDEVDEAADEAPSAFERIQDKSRLDALQVALLELPERQRTSVVLRHIEGLSNSEIAEIMGINIRAVESLTARGKAALSALLTERQTELGFANDG